MLCFQLIFEDPKYCFQWIFEDPNYCFQWIFEDFKCCVFSGYLRTLNVMFSADI